MSIVRIAAERLLIGVNFEAYGDDSTERGDVTGELINTVDKGDAGGFYRGIALMIVGRAIPGACGVGQMKY